MEKAAIILMDFVNDVVHPEGRFAFSATVVQNRKTIDKVNQLIQFGRSHHYPIIFVIMGFSPDYREAPFHSPLFSIYKEKKAFLLNTWGCALYESIQKKEEDYVVIKHRISAFYGTNLDPILRSNRIERIYVAGVATDMSVQSTIRDAHDRDYKVTCVADACASRDQITHDAALLSIRRIANIMTASELPTIRMSW